MRGRDLVLGLRVERGGGKSAGGSDALTESVALAVGEMLLEVELLAAGVEVFVAGVLCSGCEVGERGAEVLLAAALAEACLGSGALVMAVWRDGEGEVRVGSLVVRGCEAVGDDSWSAGRVLVCAEPAFASRVGETVVLEGGAKEVLLVLDPSGCLDARAACVGVAGGVVGSLRDEPLRGIQVTWAATGRGTGLLPDDKGWPGAVLRGRGGSVLEWSG